MPGQHSSLQDFSVLLPLQSPCKLRFIGEENKDDVSVEELQLSGMRLGSIKCVPRGSASQLLCLSSLVLLR